MRLGLVLGYGNAFGGESVQRGGGEGGTPPPLKRFPAPHTHCLCVSRTASQCPRSQACGGWRWWCGRACAGPAAQCVHGYRPPPSAAGHPWYCPALPTGPPAFSRGPLSWNRSGSPGPAPATLTSRPNHALVRQVGGWRLQVSNSSACPAGAKGCRRDYASGIGAGGEFTAVAVVGGLPGFC